MANLSLRTKLLILSFILALIPLGIAGRSMISITQDELKSQANSEVLQIASQISREIDDTYKDSWIAPLYIIRNALDNENLGLQEKISLLYLGVTEIVDVVSLQLTVEGVSNPAVTTNGNFMRRLQEMSVDPTENLRINPEDLAVYYGSNNISILGIKHIPQLDAWLMSVVVPLKNPVADRRAVLSTQILLDRFKERTLNHPFSEIGDIFLIDLDGNKLFYPDNAKNTSNAVVNAAMERLRSGIRIASVEPYTRESGDKMLGAYAIPTNLNWAVIVEMKAKDAYRPVNIMLKNLFFWIILGSIIAILGAILLSFSLTRPLLKLTSAANALAGGNLKIHVEGLKRKDEIGQLSTSFNKMVNELNTYIKELTETTKAKERAESELQLAHDIQQSFLPKIFPELPTMEFYGKCVPAREVGGDYFDYFKIDDERYGFVIGDVSGKGVPASLFMAVSRTLFRLLSSAGNDPDKVLWEFNERMVELDQGANLFITVFYGILNQKSGDFVYSTAGHNMPFVLNSNDDNISFKIIPRLKTLVAGMIEDIPVEQNSIKMNKDDIIVLYTDGMTEAIDEDNNEFGEQRLLETLNQNKSQSAKEICESVFKVVSEHQSGVPQFDDMTCLAIRIKDLDT